MRWTVEWHHFTDSQFIFLYKTQSDTIYNIQATTFCQQLICQNVSIHPSRRSSVPPHPGLKCSGPFNPSTAFGSQYLNVLSQCNTTLKTTPPPHTHTHTFWGSPMRRGSFWSPKKILFASILAHLFILFKWKAKKASSFKQQTEEVTSMLKLERVRYTAVYVDHAKGSMKPGSLMYWTCTSQYWFPLFVCCCFSVFWGPVRVNLNGRVRGGICLMTNQCVHVFTCQMITFWKYKVVKKTKT